MIKEVDEDDDEEEEREEKKEEELGHPCSSADGSLSAYDQSPDQSLGLELWTASRPLIG